MNPQSFTQQSNTFYSYGTYGGWGGGFGGGYGSPGTVDGIAGQVFYLINYVAVPLLFAIAFIVFLYGVAQAYIFSRGDQEGVSKGHKHILWGVIGFAVMISIWGLVNVVANTFNLGGYYAPQVPFSPTQTNAPRSNLGVPGGGPGNTSIPLDDAGNPL